MKKFNNARIQIKQLTEEWYKLALNSPRTDQNFCFRIIESWGRGDWPVYYITDDSPPPDYTRTEYSHKWLAEKELTNRLENMIKDYKEKTTQGLI